MGVAERQLKREDKMSIMKPAPGEIRTLTGLRDFPEHNGEQVKITAIREDGTSGKAYYIEGRIPLN